jgi:hypothetical protein
VSELDVAMMGLMTTYVGLCILVLGNPERTGVHAAWAPTGAGNEWFVYVDQQ